MTLFFAPFVGHQSSQARDSSVWDTENNEIHSPIQQLRFNPLDLAQGEAYMAVNCMEDRKGEMLGKKP